MVKAEVSLLAIIRVEKFILRKVAGVALLSRILSERGYGVTRCVREELDVAGRGAHNHKCNRTLSLTQSRQYLAARVGSADSSALARVRRDAWTDSICGNLGGLRL